MPVRDGGEFRLSRRTGALRRLLVLLATARRLLDQRQARADPWQNSADFPAQGVPMSSALFPGSYSSASRYYFVVTSAATLQPRQDRTETPYLL